MKHKIQFDLADDSVILEFNSNKKDSELMHFAFKKLKDEMKRRGDEDYTIYYWWWLCDDNHWEDK